MIEIDHFPTLAELEELCELGVRPVPQPFPGLAEWWNEFSDWLDTTRAELGVAGDRLELRAPPAAFEAEYGLFSYVVLHSADGAVED